MKMFLFDQHGLIGGQDVKRNNMLTEKAAGVVSLAAGHSLALGNHSIRPYIPVWHHLILLIIIFIRRYVQEFLAGYF